MFSQMHLNTQIKLLLIAINIVILIYFGWDSYLQHKQTSENSQYNTTIFANELLSVFSFIAQNHDLSSKTTIDTINSADIGKHPKPESNKFARVIIIIIPMEQKLHDILAIRIISFTLLCLTLTLLLYLIIHKCFVQPLKHLAFLADMISSDIQNSRDMYIITSLEIETVFRGFHSMTENLRDLRDNLEAKINVRTQELTVAYQALQLQAQSSQKGYEDLAKAYEAKSELLATMSHEIKTPLTAIIAYAELILEQGTEKEETTENTYNIYQSAHHLLDLITDLLDLSKIETGKMQLHLTIFEIPEIFTTLERIFYPLIKRNGLTFNVEISGELPVIQADKNKLKQILMNLLSNAIKFTSAGGSIYLTAIYLNNEHKLLVSVRDTGKGIPANDFLTIFGKYSQLDSKRTKDYGGIGLGLAITKYLVELHGGTIWIESTIGKGSTFFFEVPMFQLPERFEF